MNSSARLEALLKVAEQLDVDIRAEPMGGDGGGMARLKGRRVLFVDTSADLATRYERTLAAVADLPDLEGAFLPPQVREDLERQREASSEVLMRNRLNQDRRSICLNVFLLLGFFMCASQTASAGEEWSPAVFDYDPPDRLEVHEASTRKPYNISGTRQEELVFKDTRGKNVPVLITMPQGRDGPFPLVVLVHGFTSNKEEVSRQLAGVLTQRGFACIAMDMPGHGERPGEPRDMFGPDRKAAYENVVEAVMDIRQTIDLAERRKLLDTSQGVLLVGYSMGSWIGTLACAADRRVHAMVLMVAGSATTAAKDTKDEIPGLKDRLELVHHYAVLRHNAALPKFAPRPVLLMNGKKDVLVPAELAKILFESAGQPKEHRWYNAGHLLPPEAYRDAADWLTRQIKHPS